jgi:hypothetical protein
LSVLLWPYAKPAPSRRYTHTQWRCWRRLCEELLDSPAKCHFLQQHCSHTRRWHGTRELCCPRTAWLHLHLQQGKATRVNPVPFTGHLLGCRSDALAEYALCSQAQLQGGGALSLEGTIPTSVNIINSTFRYYMHLCNLCYVCTPPPAGAATRKHSTIMIEFFLPPCSQLQSSCCTWRWHLAGGAGCKR